MYMALITHGGKDRVTLRDIYSAKCSRNFEAITFVRDKDRHRARTVFSNKMRVISQQFTLFHA